MEEYWTKGDTMEEQKEEEEEGVGTTEPQEEKEEERRGAKRSVKDRLGNRRIKLDRQDMYISSVADLDPKLVGSGSVMT